MFTKHKNELRELLEPIKKRLFLKKLSYSLLLSLLVAVGSGVLLLVCSRFFFFYYRLELALGLLLAALLAAVVYAIYTRPDEWAAASYADRYGLQEKISTALEFQGDHSRWAEVQREDALLHLRQALASIMASIRIWPFTTRRRLFLFGTAVLFWLFFYIWPNPLEDEYLISKAEQEALAAIEEQVEEQIEQVAEDQQLAEEQQEQLTDLFEQFKQELLGADDLAERLALIEEKRKELAALEEAHKQQQELLEMMRDQLAEEQRLQDVAEALSAEEQEALQQALQEVSEILASLTPEEQAELAQFLQELAEELSASAQEGAEQDVAAFAEALQEAAKQLNNGNLAQSMAALQQAMLQAQAQFANAQQMGMHLAQGQNMFQQAQGSLAQANPAAASSFASSRTTPGQTAGKGTPATSPSSAQGSKGQGANGSGTGSGSGAGSNGQGAGTGSGSGSGSGLGSGSGQGAGQGSGAGLGEGSRQLVTVPSERLDAQGAEGSVGGALGEEGSSESRWSSSGQVSSGMARAYEEVFQEYQEQARESLQRSDIPADYQQLVRDYFSDIEP